MEWTIEQVNTIGEAFAGLALPMLAGSAALIGVVLAVEFMLRNRVRAAFRYWLVVCVLAYLYLLPLLSLSPPSTHWPAGKAAYADPTLPLPASHTRVPLPQPTTGQSQTTLAGAGERPEGLSWQGIAFVVWLVGAAAMGGVLMHRTARTCRQVADSPGANFLMNDILTYCRKRMGVAGPVRLKVSGDGAGPVVYGLFQPVVMVPRNLAPTLGSRHLRDVLFHEMAHIKRHDLWVNLAQNVTQVLYFYNPLLWLANAAIRRLRDEAANEAVLDTIGEAGRSYMQRIGDVAALAAARPAPSFAPLGVA